MVAGTLVRRHAERLVRVCARLVGDVSLGRELAQDTWVLLWRGRDKYRPEGRFIAWLITVARNHCRNEIRRRQSASKRATALAMEPDSGRRLQLDLLLEQERQGRVRQALEQLSSPHREALLLRVGEGLRYDEMKQVTQASDSTLRSRVHHGLKALKQKLEKDL
jgi:RNA polymerase sigma-70 factor (ECF subfamily)